MAMAIPNSFFILGLIIGKENLPVKKEKVLYFVLFR
jgi:hypothetical protein